MTSVSKDISGQNRRVLAAGFVGNILEWYDFAVYGFFAATIGKLFFPSDDPTTSLIASFGAFAAGFLMRPMGAVLFGHVGDLLGCKKALTLSPDSPFLPGSSRIRAVLCSLYWRN